MSRLISELDVALEERAAKGLRRERRIVDSAQGAHLRVDGREVLQIVKSDPALRTIPIVVVTTSEADSDIQNSYGLGANCYVTKPVGLDQFLKVVHSIEDFWMTVVKLPSPPP